MKRLILFASAGLVLACLAGAGVLLVLNPSRSGPNIHAIPIYPGAVNVRVQDSQVQVPIQSFQVATGTTHIQGRSVLTSGSASLSSTSFSNVYMGHIYFTTNDSPQQVYSFYDDLLTTAGWTSLIATGKQAAP